MRRSFQEAIYPAARASGIDATRARRAKKTQLLASYVLQATVTLIAALSISNFNEALVPAGLGNLQQAITLALWVLAIAMTTLQPVTLRLSAGTDFLAIIVFYAYAALSVAWSDHSSATFLKGGALVITTFGAFRLATHMAIDDFIGALLRGFMIVCVASIAMVLFVPAIGVDHTWMHEGNWQGVFESKQSLGTLGAFSMFFAFYCFMTRRKRLRFVAAFIVALACVIGSGSRGGAAVALAACITLSLPRSWRGAQKFLAFFPLLIMSTAVIGIIYIIDSGDPYLPLFGMKVDFTERAIIWQYALSHFSESPLLGFGLNGFWSIPEIYHAFERVHGWVLDNYHDGYVGILIETGLVGFVLFAAAIFLFGMKMSLWLGSTPVVRPSETVIIAFMNLIFFIDLTETFFLRSTNINSVAFTTFLFMSCQRIYRSSVPLQTNASERS